MNLNSRKDSRGNEQHSRTLQEKAYMSRTTESPLRTACPWYLQRLVIDIHITSRSYNDPYTARKSQPKPSRSLFHYLHIPTNPSSPSKQSSAYKSPPHPSTPHKSPPPLSTRPPPFPPPSPYPSPNDYQKTLSPTPPSPPPPTP